MTAGATSRTPAFGASVPVWWLVFRRELGDLWIGGKGMSLLILYCVLMSITAFLLGTNSELSLTPPRSMIIILIQSAITFGLFIGIVIGSEAVSGERERATLEPLLLAPAERREILLGKYLAALSPWPIAYLLLVPYVVVLAQGDLALVPALVWGALVGSLVTITFTGLGLIVSTVSNSSRTSLFVALLIYLLAVLPSQLPGEFQGTTVGAIVHVVDPLEAVRVFLIDGFIAVKQVGELWPLLYAPIAICVLVVAAVLFVAPGRLGLEAGGRETGEARPSAAEGSR